MKKYPLTRANRRRITNALSALDTYEAITGAIGRDPETTIRDLLCDLRHLCASRRFDFDTLSLLGARHFHVESTRSHPEYAESQVE